MSAYQPVSRFVLVMLSVEAAGNNEPLSRATGLQARRGAQDFRRCNIKVDALMDVGQ